MLVLSECILWNKRQEVDLWSGMVSVRDVWLCRCIIDVQSEATGRIVFVLWVREVRTDHLCDRKLHCVVLHSNPWVLASQGDSIQTVPLRGHNWVLREGQTKRLEAFWVFLLLVTMDRILANWIMLCLPQPWTNIYKLIDLSHIHIQPCLAQVAISHYL
jgi:hypothetical protein